MKKKTTQKRHEFLELKRAFCHLRESQKFLRRLLACVCLKYGKLTLDTEFYRIPDDPEILTHQDEHGQTVVELRAILPIDPKKHAKWKSKQRPTQTTYYERS